MVPAICIIFEAQTRVKPHKYFNHYQHCMKFYKTPTPPMQEGFEKEMMTFILEQVKRTKGLTSVIDHVAGINGKWIKPEAPRNISITLFIRMMILKVQHQDYDELMRDLKETGDFALFLIEKYGIDTDSTRKQRPPWLRRKICRRYHSQQQ